MIPTRRTHFHILVTRCFTAAWIVCCFTALCLGDWPYQATMSPWRIHADFPLDSIRSTLGDLPQIRREVLTRLHLSPTDAPIDVYLFSSKDVYEGYMRRYFPDVVPRRAMFIQATGPGNVFAYASPELATDLRHECTHAVLHATLPLVPLWLDEGLAEYFEVPADARAMDNPHMAAVQRGLLWKRPPSLERLEGIQELSRMGPLEYEEAWAWVHFFLHGPPNAQRCLIQYLDDLARHTPPRPLSEQIQQTTTKPNREFASHFRRWK